MIRLSQRLAVSLLSVLLLTSCAGGMITSDWAGSVTLPASGDCYSFHVMSGREERWPAASEECKHRKAHAVWLYSEDYKLLREDIERNCQFQQCTQIRGAFDALFLAIDRSLQQVP